MKDEESVENTLCEIKPINMGKTRIPKILVVASGIASACCYVCWMNIVVK